MSGIDEELRALRRRLVASPDDELLKERIARIEARLEPPKAPEPPPPPPPPPGPDPRLVRQFVETTSWLATSLGIPHESGVLTASLVLRNVTDRAGRDRPHWCWIRGTQAAWSTRPVFLAARSGGLVRLSVNVTQTGPQNIAVPDMVWPELRPWLPGAHDHPVASPAGMGFEIRSSFEDGDDNPNGACRRCGEGADPRLRLARHAFEERLARWVSTDSERSVAGWVDVVRAAMEAAVTIT